MYVLKTPEGKKVVITPKKDEKLYDAPVNPPDTGLNYTSGTDLYRHVARSGKAYYYTYDWSMWQGTKDRYALLTEEEAKQFLIRAAGWTGYAALSPEEEKRAQEVFPNIFDEDA